MVSKTLVHKKIYTDIKSREDLPEMSVEDIGEILINDPRGIPNYVKYEISTHPVNFRSVMEGTRKDIVFHYNDPSRESIYGDPKEYEGISYGIIIDHRPIEIP